MTIDDVATTAPEIKEDERCGNCHFFRGGTCRKSWPVLFGDGKQRWAPVEEGEWCGHYKSAAAVQLWRETKGAVSLSDVAIVRLVDNSPGMGQDKLITLLREINPGMSEAGAQMRITKLIGRGKLGLNEDQEIESKVLPRGAGVKNKFQEWAPHLERHISSIEDAVGYQQLYRLCNEIKPISKSSFGKMLNRTLESGSLSKTDNGKYWMPPAGMAASFDLWSRFKAPVLELVPDEKSAKNNLVIWEILGLPEEIDREEFKNMLGAARGRGELLTRMQTSEEAAGREPRFLLYAATPKPKAGPKLSPELTPLRAAKKPDAPAAPVIKTATFDSPVGPDGRIDWGADMEAPT